MRCKQTEYNREKNEKKKWEIEFSQGFSFRGKSWK